MPLVDSENANNVMATNMPSSSSSSNDDVGPVGCYLVFEPSSGGRLLVQYSKGTVPENAVGFFAQSQSMDAKPIPKFKFTTNGGKSELIKGIAGGDANRKKYYVGWCLFLKLACQFSADVICFTPTNSQYVKIDVYGIQGTNVVALQGDLERGLTSINDFDAIAVLPKHSTFLQGCKTTQLQTFLEKANISGAATLLRK